MISIDLKIVLWQFWVFSGCENPYDLQYNHDLDLGHVIKMLQLPCWGLKTNKK